MSVSCLCDGVASLSQLTLSSKTSTDSFKWLARILRFPTSGVAGSIVLYSSESSMKILRACISYRMRVSRVIVHRRTSAKFRDSPLVHCKVVLQIPQRASDDRLHGQLGSLSPVMLVRVLMRLPVEARLCPVRPVARLKRLDLILVAKICILPVPVRRRSGSLPANLACRTGVCVERRRKSREDTLCSVEKWLGICVHSRSSCWMCGV